MPWTSGVFGLPGPIDYDALTVSMHLRHNLMQSLPTEILEA